MAQHQPREHDNARRQQRGDDNQDQYVGFTRLHGTHFRLTTRFAPFLKRLHVVIKLLRHRNQRLLQQIVIPVRALVIQGFQHRVDPLLAIRRQAGRHFIEQLLPLLVSHAAVDHAFQRFLGQGNFLIDVFYRFGRIVQHADFHHADGLARLIARAQDQRIA